MIEKMKKLTLLVSWRDTEGFVARLREVGVVHIKHVKKPAHHEITFIEDKSAKIDHAISILEPYVAPGEKKERKCQNDKKTQEHADLVAGFFKQRIELEARQRDLERHIEWFKLWGRFDPEDLEALKQKGVHIKLYRLKKEEFTGIKKGKSFFVIKKEKGFVYIATAALSGEEGIEFSEIVPPPEGTGKMEEELTSVKYNIGKIEDFFKAEAKKIVFLKEYKEKLLEKHEFLKVRFGMAEEEKFSYLQGFCPVRALKKITSMAKERGIGYVVEEPDDPEETPTLITNPKWIRIVEPIFSFMNTLPGYEEFDISFVFLAFFGLFFSMLIGDAGYGLIFLLATFLARQKLKKAPSEVFFLMYVLSFGTIIWGAVTGTWFGAEQIAQLPVFRGLIVEKISSFAGNNQNLMIYICFVIGVIHLTIAHLFIAIKVINSLKVISEVGWIMILWGMFFTAGTFVIGNAFPPQAGWLFIAGIATVLICSHPEKGILKGILSTMADLPLSIISSFSDIVSYLRLFAVGYASVVVAQSFNNMALSGGPVGILGGIVAALILFLGHALNIVLGLMAVVVHGIRLNMLEFSGHLGMQWSGKKYEPFKEK